MPFNAAMPSSGLKKNTSPDGKTYRYRRGDEPTVATLTVRLLAVNASDSVQVERLHRWMNLSHVSEFWQQAWPVERIDGYLKKQVTSYHEVFWVYLNEMPVAYTELYPVTQDLLGQNCVHDINDWGWHLLIGPPTFIGCGLSPAIGHAILSHLFNHTLANEIFCEPDHRNGRMIKFVSRLAHRDRGLVQLGSKCARLMTCHRNDFDRLTLPTLNYKPSTNCQPNVAGLKEFQL